MEVGGIIELVTSLVSILIIATIVYSVCKQLNFPFTVGLVLAGVLIAHLDDLGLSNLHSHLHVKITPDIVMFVFLPTLIFESAYNLDGNSLRRNIIPVLTLAIPGLLLSTFTIGFIVWNLSPFDFVSSLLLGAILSATDPVAVIALFKQLGAPKRLTVLVEGESLFNDATAVVTAKIIFAVMMAGAFSIDQVEHGIVDFIWEFFGGIFVGWLMAMLVALIIGYVAADIAIEISLTMILAYSSFIVAQELFEVSGIMATVSAGVILGGWGRTKISPSVAHFLHQYWDYLAFIANALIFLLVGLSVDLTQFSSNLLVLLVIVILAMLISRAMVVYGFVPLVCKLPNSPNINRPYQHVMYWGGLRGAIALAIVLGLGDFKYANEFIILVTGAVLFTLLVQGLSMEMLVKWLGLDKPPLSDQLAKIEGELNARKHALERLPDLQKGGLFSGTIAKNIQQQLNQEIDAINLQLDQLTQQQLSAREEQKLLLLQGLATQKSQYYTMFVQGHISEYAYRVLNYIADVHADQLRYWDKLPTHYQPIESQKKLQRKFYQIAEVIPFVSHLVNRIRSNHASRSYEVIWGQHQGCIFVLDYFNTLKQETKKNQPIIANVIDYFQQWRDYTQIQLDDMAEQFPDFVTSMQKSLAHRLVLQAEKDIVMQQAREGTLSAGVANAIKHEFERQEWKIRENKIRPIELDPSTCLRKVTFFKDSPEQELNRIKAYLKQRIVAANEAIITEGESGDSLFLIMRGVVRVTKTIHGKEFNLATLVAGDFFGEMALLHREPRIATCRAVTPCSVYELSRHDLQHVKQSCPSIQHALEVADRERRRVISDHQ